MKVFLFTDVESSTRLWEERPEEMGAAIDRHYSMLTGSVTSAGGQVLKTTGDGLIAVFDTAGAALAAALAAQRDLGSGDGLKVRMGVHAGEAEEHDGDYFGQVMNRAARIMAVGHGGQVVVSEITAELAGDRLPSGAALRDLGTHRLRDLTLPEHLFQLVHETIPGEFPPLLSLDARPNNLPLQDTEFLGRRAEIGAIQSMLLSSGTRLVTIAGPGGAGKTRLGLQVAAEILDQFRDGVSFVDLSPERDPDAAFESVVRALDLPSTGGAGPLEVLKSRLRDKEMLLLLDNFEQVTSAATGVVELLGACPHLKILVTSRETLRVRPEHVYPVPPLGLPDPRAGVAAIAEAESVQLFGERARAVRPDFTLDDGNAEAVAMICLRLDGLPLAIELAAARLNLFSPQDLLERLRGRLDILGSGGRDLPDRQRTLWGAIGWSYELLAEHECRVFEMMSVFSTARLDAVEAVAGPAMGSVGLLDALASLVDKSLIRSEDVDGTRRFSMLLMIREFAAERLAADPEFENAVRHAHATHFRDYTRELSARLPGAERHAVLAELAVEIGNLRSAWRYWVEQADVEELFSLVDGLWALHDAKGWYRAAIELASDALGVLATSPPSPDLIGQELTLRTGLARALMAVRGYGAEVEQAFREVLDIARASGGAAHQYPVLRALATYYMNISNWESSRDLGEQILDLAREQSDEGMLIEGNFVYGVSVAFLGDLERGMPLLDEVIRAFDPAVHGTSRFRLGPQVGVSARVASGLLQWQVGLLEQGIARVEDALSFAKSMDHPYTEAYAIYHNGFLDLSRRRLPECLARAGELAAVAGDNGYAVWETLATVLEGVSRTLMGESEEGLRLTEAGITLYEGLGAPPVFWPLILHMRGIVRAHAGDPQGGLDLIEEAIAISPVEPAVADFLVTKGDVLRMLTEPDLDGAIDFYRRAVAGARQTAAPLVELQALNRLVELSREGRAMADMTEQLRAVYDRFTEGFDEYELVAARRLLGMERATTSG